MLYITEQKELELERLPLNESDTSSPVFINVRNNDRLNSNIINLEQVIDYANNNELTINEAVHQVCYYNDLNEDSIVFSVQPSSLYLNEEVIQIAPMLFEEDKLYLLNNVDSIESRIIDAVCEDCIETGSTELFDKLIDSINEGMISSFIQGAVDRSAKLAGGLAAGGINAVVNGSKKGFAKGVSGLVNDKMGQFLDIPGQNGGDSVKNGRVLNFLHRFHINTAGTGSQRDKEITGLANSTINGVRKEISDNTVNSLLKLTGIDPDAKTDVSKMLNNVERKISYFKTQIFNAKGDENKKSIMQRAYDKLVELKNKLMDKIRRK